MEFSDTYLKPKGYEERISYSVIPPGRRSIAAVEIPYFKQKKIAVVMNHSFDDHSFGVKRSVLKSADSLKPYSVTIEQRLRNSDCIKKST